MKRYNHIMYMLRFTYGHTLIYACIDSVCVRLFTLKSFIENIYIRHKEPNYSHRLYRCDCVWILFYTSQMCASHQELNALYTDSNACLCVHLDTTYMLDVAPPIHSNSNIRCSSRLPCYDYALDRIIYFFFFSALLNTESGVVSLHWTNRSDFREW